MSHEFPEEELLECTACGAVLPYGMMTFLDDGRIVCPDCYEELMGASDVCACEEESETTQAIDSDSYDGIDERLRQLSFMSRLPGPLKKDFIAEMNSGNDPFSNESMMKKTDGLTIKDFNAIDFETANSSRSSVCSVGIVFVRGGKIVDSFYSLIRPEPDYYSYWCQRVHGLGPDDTDDAPNFRTVWNKIRSKVKKDGVPFIAHNKGFDESCLRAVFQTYRMDYPEYQFLDTLAVSRRYFGDSLPNHELQTVAAACGYDLTKHHHALADAEACAAIALKIMPLTEIL